MIIVIDGPSGSGKSTLAKRLAKELNYTFFDTGAMYRAFCVYLLNKKIPLDDLDQIRTAIEGFHFRVQTNEKQPLFFVNGEDVSKKIRSHEISKKASIVAAYPFVRDVLVRAQRNFAQGKKAIFEGRDMGSVVFPKADVKFFLLADVSIRAKRRFEELKALDPDGSYDLSKIRSDIVERDTYDSTRSCSPLKQAEDAFVIDSSHLSIEQVLNTMKNYIEEKSL